MDGPDNHMLSQTAAHVYSIAAIAGTFAGLLPPLAATAAFVWYCLAVYEILSKWWSKRRKRKLKHAHRKYKRPKSNQET